MLTDFIFIAIALAFIAWQWRPMTRAIRSDRTKLMERSTRRIKEFLDASLCGEHEYAAVDIANYDELEIDFYEDVRHTLEPWDFVWLEDFEDKTMSRAAPQARTVVRLMSGEAGQVVATIQHARLRGVAGWAAPFLGLKTNALVVEFVSELTDGRFVVTNNARRLPALPFPEDWSMLRLPHRTDPLELLKRHHEHLESALVEDDATIHPRALVNLEETMEMIQRQWTALSAHYGTRRGITEEEWASYTGDDPNVSREINSALEELFK